MKVIMYPNKLGYKNISISEGNIFQKILPHHTHSTKYWPQVVSWICYNYIEKNNEVLSLTGSYLNVSILEQYQTQKVIRDLYHDFSQ